MIYVERSQELAISEMRVMRELRCEVTKVVILCVARKVSVTL